MRQSLRYARNGVGLTIYFLSLSCEFLNLPLLPLVLKITSLLFLDFKSFYIGELISSIHILFSIYPSLKLYGVLGYFIGILAYSIIMKGLSLLLFRKYTNYGLTTL